MIWTSGIWKNVSEVSISRHFLSPVFPCVSEQKAVCGWKPGSGFPAEFVRLLARLRITGRPYAQHSVSSQASKAQHPQNKRREKCICSHSQRRLASLWRCPKPPSPLVSVVWTQVRPFCRTFVSNSVGHHIIILYHENCKLAQMCANDCFIASLSSCSGQFLGGPHISCVAPHTYIEWKAKFNAIWQISVDLDHFPENGLLLPTPWVEGKSRPLSGKSTSQSNCLLGKHIMLAGEHKNEQQRFRRFSSLQNVLPPCTKWYCQN